MLVKPQNKGWFFEVTGTELLPGVRLRDGDQPNQNTFENLLESVILKADQDSKAKKDVGTFREDIPGVVVLSTDEQAKANIAQKPDRSLVVQPHQLPTVVSTDSNISVVKSAEASRNEYEISVVGNLGGLNSNKQGIKFITNFWDAISFTDDKSLHLKTGYDFVNQKISGSSSLQADSSIVLDTENTIDGSKFDIYVSESIPVATTGNNVLLGEDNYKLTVKQKTGDVLIDRFNVSNKLLSEGGFRIECLWESSSNKWRITTIDEKDNKDSYDNGLETVNVVTEIIDGVTRHIGIVSGKKSNILIASETNLDAIKCLNGKPINNLNIRSNAEIVRIYDNVPISSWGTRGTEFYYQGFGDRIDLNRYQTYGFASLGDYFQEIVNTGGNEDYATSQELLAVDGKADTAQRKADDAYGLAETADGKTGDNYTDVSNVITDFNVVSKIGVSASGVAGLASGTTTITFPSRPRRRFIVINAQATPYIEGIASIQKIMFSLRATIRTNVTSNTNDAKQFVCDIGGSGALNKLGAPMNFVLDSTLNANASSVDVEFELEVYQDGGVITHPVSLSDIRFTATLMPKER